MTWSEYLDSAVVHGAIPVWFADFHDTWCYMVFNVPDIKDGKIITLHQRVVYPPFEPTGHLASDWVCKRVQSVYLHEIYEQLQIGEKRPFAEEAELVHG